MTYRNLRTHVSGLHFPKSVFNCSETSLSSCSTSWNFSRFPSKLMTPELGGLFNAFSISASMRMVILTANRVLAISWEEVLDFSLKGVQSACYLCWVIITASAADSGSIAGLNVQRETVACRFALLKTWSCLCYIKRTVAGIVCGLIFSAAHNDALPRLTSFGKKLISGDLLYPITTIGDEDCMPVPNLRSLES